MGKPMYISDLPDLDDEEDDGDDRHTSYADLPDLEGETYYEDPEHNDMTVGDVQVRDPNETDPNDDQHGAMKRLLAFGNGLVGNFGGELAKLATRGADYLSPQGLSGVGVGDPQLAEDMVTQASQQHPGYNVAGGVTSATLGGALAPARVAAQAAVGAAHAAASEYGDSHDLGDAAQAGVVGGATAGGAQLLGKGLGRVFGRAPEGPVMQLGEEAPMAPKPFSNYPGQSREALQGAETYVGPTPAAHPAGPPKAPPDMLREGMGALMSPRKAMLRAGGRAIAGAKNNTPNEGVEAAVTGGSVGAGSAIGLLARTNNERVPANKSVVNWALKQTLTDAKGAGLTDKDTADLMEVYQTGDQAGIATRLYTLQQKNPLFAKKYIDALNRANGDRE